MIGDREELRWWLERGPDALASVPLPWRTAFEVDRRYRARRDAWLGSRAPSERELRLEPSALLRLNLVDLVPDSAGEATAILLDVFVPPDIDVKPPRAERPADLPPATLYLGTVTGTPPLTCHLTGLDGHVRRAERLFKGWSELVLPLRHSGVPNALDLFTHAHLFKPIGLRVVPIFQHDVTGDRSLTTGEQPVG